MTVPPPTGRQKRRGSAWPLAIALGGGGLFVLALGIAYLAPAPPRPPRPRQAPKSRPDSPPLQLARGGQLTVWWDSLPDAVRHSTVSSGQDSNIHPSDYAGPDSCKGCHP